MRRRWWWGGGGEEGLGWRTWRWRRRSLLRRRRLPVLALPRRAHADRRRGRGPDRGRGGGGHGRGGDRAAGQDGVGGGGRCGGTGRGRKGEASAVGSPCSVTSDCSSVASADFEGVGLGFFGAAADGGAAMVFEDSAASAATVEAEARVAAGARSVFAVECVPLWGHKSICGRRPEMEDAVVAVSRFFDIPLWMLTGNSVVDGLDPMSFRLPAHFFGVYDGHGGAQVKAAINDASLRIPQLIFACK